MKHILVAGMMAAVVAPVVAQSNLTVGSVGSGATHNNLRLAALALDKTDGPEPNRITFIDDGPFIEVGWVRLDEHDTGHRELIVEAAEGVNPTVVVSVVGNQRAGIFLRKEGKGMTLRDFTLLPTTNAALAPEAAIELQCDDNFATSVTLENILISSNDGNNQPIASRDGLTEPVFDANTVSFGDEGIFMPSASGRAVAHNLTIRDVTISGLDGGSGSDGIRIQADGGPGSMLTVGPGVTVSYLQGSRPAPTPISTGSAFQPGGADNFTINVVGTQESPVRFINNNTAGIGVTYAPTANGVDLMEWVIIANNNGAGIVNTSRHSTNIMRNVTIANNQMGAITGPPIPAGIDFQLSNVIVAGNGDDADTTNVLLLTKYSGDAGGSASTFTATDSAIVLAGDYTLNTQDFGGDGINSDSFYTVTLTDVINSDPGFVSLDPTHAGFAEVTNPAYATAGPNGEALVGGGTYNNTSVRDWSVY